MNHHNRHIHCVLSKGMHTHCALSGGIPTVRSHNRIGAHQMLLLRDDTLRNVAPRTDGRIDEQRVTRSAAQLLWILALLSAQEFSRRRPCWFCWLLVGRGWVYLRPRCCCCCCWPLLSCAPACLPACLPTSSAAVASGVPLRFSKSCTRARPRATAHTTANARCSFVLLVGCQR